MERFYLIDVMKNDGSYGETIACKNRYEANKEAISYWEGLSKIDKKETRVTVVYTEKTDLYYESFDLEDEDFDPRNFVYSDNNADDFDSSNLYVIVETDEDGKDDWRDDIEDLFPTVEDAIRELKYLNEEKNNESTVFRIERMNGYFCGLTMRDLRKISGMTQAEFGDYFGIHLRTIQKWENNERVYPSYLVDLIEYKLRKENLIPSKKSNILHVYSAD